jgi:hypothetical protein
VDGELLGGHCWFTLAHRKPINKKREREKERERERERERKEIMQSKQ